MHLVYCQPPPGNNHVDCLAARRTTTNQHTNLGNGSSNHSWIRYLFVTGMSYVLSHLRRKGTEILDDPSHVSAILVEHPTVEPRRLGVFSPKPFPVVRRRGPLGMMHFSRERHQNRRGTTPPVLFLLFTPSRRLLVLLCQGADELFGKSRDVRCVLVHSLLSSEIREATKRSREPGRNEREIERERSRVRKREQRKHARRLEKSGMAKVRPRVAPKRHSTACVVRGSMILIWPSMCLCGLSLPWRVIHRTVSRDLGEP